MERRQSATSAGINARTHPPTHTPVRSPPPSTSRAPVETSQILIKKKMRKRFHFKTELVAAAAAAAAAEVEVDKSSAGRRTWRRTYMRGQEPEVYVPPSPSHTHPLHTHTHTHGSRRRFTAVCEVSGMKSLQRQAGQITPGGARRRHIHTHAHTHALPTLEKD